MGDQLPAENSIPGQANIDSSNAQYPALNLGSKSTIELLPLEIRRKIYGEHWTHGSLKLTIDGRPWYKVIQVVGEDGWDADLRSLRESLTLFYVNKQIHNEFAEFIFSQIRLKFQVTITRTWELDQTVLYNLWLEREEAPGVRVRELMAILHEEKSLLKWVRDIRMTIMFSFHHLDRSIASQQAFKNVQLRDLAKIMTTWFPNLQLPSLGKLDIVYFANDMSSEDILNLMPVFNMNVSHLGLKELGFTSEDMQEKRLEKLMRAANWATDRMDHEDHEKNFTAAKFAYADSQVALGLIYFDEPTSDDMTKFLVSTTGDPRGQLFSEETKIQVWQRRRVWEQCVRPGHWN